MRRLSPSSSLSLLGDCSKSSSSAVVVCCEFVISIILASGPAFSPPRLTRFVFFVFFVFVFFVFFAARTFFAATDVLRFFFALSFVFALNQSSMHTCEEKGERVKV